MVTFRLLADDLTGALDTSAELVGLCGSVEVSWVGTLPAPLPPSLAVDTGTREMASGDARRVTKALASVLCGADIAYKKVDSLLRGPWATELAACFRRGSWRYGVLAPAFPYQGRCTRNSRQLARGLDGSWTAVSGHLAEALSAEGIVATRAEPSRPLAEGISVFDAETEVDLERIVATARAIGERVLWCGSGGLARALAAGHAVEASRVLQPPVLGLFGSDHAATAVQLSACTGYWLGLAGRRDEAAMVRDRLAGDGVVLASVDLPADTSRADAAQRIARTLGDLALALPPPGTLIVAGGETLKSLCMALGTRSLRVTGQVAPGLPRSIMQGGHWDGVEVVSKSGAFGGSSLWRDLLAENGLPARGDGT